jgi:N-acetylmuramoyl-L-alanine amidase
MALPAQAARLQTWGFDASRNQLEFTIDAGVQPKAQLITNPTRLVIDLPGVIFGRSQATQVVNSATIRSLRVGQFEKDTTRVVVELEPGYTLDPKQVKFKGTASGRWTVTIPPPTRQPVMPLPNPVQPDIGANVPNNVVAGTQIQSVQTTGDGFFIRTSGQSPQIRLNRSGDRRRIEVDLIGASISPSLSPRDFLGTRHGVQRVIVSQPQGQPPIARVTLLVDPSASDWRATYSNAGGVVLLSASRPNSGTQPAPNLGTDQLTTIQAVNLDSTGQRLTIAGNQPIVYTAGWDRSAAYYKMTVQNAQLDPQLKGPLLGNNSPLLKVLLRQETPRTVAILVSPAAGVMINNPISTGPQSIALPLVQARSTPPVTFPTDGTIVPVPPTAPAINIPVPPAPAVNIPAPPTAPGSLPAPTTPIGRSVVVIDPGHGGPDPGAVGRGGIQEKEIVLDISRQVASILAQNGVQPILTRDRDMDLDLQPRVDIAERAKATLFVSIHANAISMSRPDVNGLEVYYYQSGLGLAQSIQANILRTTNIADRGVRQGRFYVIRRTSMPSVLVETGFVTGATDAANFQNPAHRRNLAQGIANGILNYLRQQR